MSPSFEALMKDFLASQCMTWAEGSLGLTFESEGVEVFVMEHPLYDDKALLDVGVRQFNALDQALVAPLMLQINEVSRFEHDWAIVMDGQGLVSLSRTAALQSLRAPELEALMADGIDRALALQDMLSARLESSTSGDAPFEAAGLDADLSAGMLRG